jgi:hypothetical protein
MHPVLDMAPPLLAKEEGSPPKRTKLRNQRYQAFPYDCKTNRILPLGPTDLTS